MNKYIELFTQQGYRATYVGECDYGEHWEGANDNGDSVHIFRNFDSGKVFIEVTENRYA